MASILQSLVEFFCALPSILMTQARQEEALRVSRAQLAFLGTQVPTPASHTLRDYTLHLTGVRGVKTSVAPRPPTSTRLVHGRPGSREPYLYFVFICHPF